MKGLWSAGLVVALLGLAGAGWAQNPGANDQNTLAQLTQQIRELQQHDRELEERIKILESQHASAAPGSPAAESPPTPAAAAEADQSMPASEHELHGIQWQGFGEVNYKVLDQRQPELGTYGFNPGSSGNFYTGDFGLFLTSRLSERTYALADIAFEETNAQSFLLDLRRVLLKYDFNDHCKLSFGRYQTGIGYYNWAFPSAAWLQTTADRPLVMEFASNGGLLPTQAVGVSLTGVIPSGKLGLNYIAEYGSSNTIRPDISGSGTQDVENNSNHVLLGFFVRPDYVPGLQAGGSYYHDKITNNLPGQSDRYGQTIVNAHVTYTAHRVEWLNEGFLIRHAELHGPDLFNMPAFYSQLSKQWGRIRPFVRYQYVNANPASIFEDILLRHGPSFGVRYDFNDYIAFKAQLDNTVRKGQPDLNGLHLQAAFSF